MTKRALSRILATTALAAVVAVGAISPAAADEPEPVPAPVASAQGWDISVGNIGASVKLNGAVGWLLGPLVNPIVNRVLTPVTGLVNRLPNALVNPILGAVAGFDLRAGTPSPGAPHASAPFDLASGGVSPTAENLASCAYDGSTCYRSWAGELSGIDVALAGMLELELGVIHGLTEFVGTADGHDIVAQSEVAGLGLGLLGIPILDLGAVNSKAQCTVVGGTPNSANTEIAGLDLLGGLIGVGLAEGTDALEVTVDGVPLLGVDEMPVGVGVGDGLLSDITLDEELLRVTVGLDVGDLLGALGAAGNLVDDFLKYLVNPKAGAHLVIEVAAASDADATSAAAHGLRVGVGLNLDLSLNLLGLIGATISVAGSEADVAGNILQLDLAQAQCASTALPGSENTWIPSGIT